MGIDELVLERMLKDVRKLTVDELFERVDMFYAVKAGDGVFFTVSRDGRFIHSYASPKSSAPQRQLLAIGAHLINTFGLDAYRPDDTVLANVERLIRPIGGHESE